MITDFADGTLKIYIIQQQDLKLSVKQVKEKIAKALAAFYIQAENNGEGVLHNQLSLPKTTSSIQTIGELKEIIMDCKIELWGSDWII